MLATPAAALLAAGLLAGCSGGGDDGDPEVASVSQSQSEDAGADQATDGDEVEQAQAFVDCLRDQGLEVEDPDPVTGELDMQGFVQGDIDRDTLTKAMEACGDEAPQSLQDRAGQEPDTEQMQEFAQCMRDNDVDMADPGPEGFDPGALPTGDPDFETALEACRDQLNFGGGSEEETG